jgi:hypothetical protein
MEPFHNQQELRLVTVTACLVVVLAATVLAEPATSEWVYADSNEKLVYMATPAGDRIMDFSYAGFRGGGVAIPSVSVKRSVEPSGGDDDTALIQAAIDEVAQLPLEGGFRGAVVLGSGTFHCTGTIRIPASGIVLRGSGSDGSSKTTIQLAGRPHGAISVGVRDRNRRGGNLPDDDSTAGVEPKSDFKTSRTKIADKYVPSGSISFTVADAEGFAAGDTIAIRKPVTDAWIEFMQMHDLVRDGQHQTWIRPGSVLVTERRITELDNNRITLDVPLSDAFDAKYLDPPGVEVEKIRPPRRLSQIGVEDLHIESPPQPFNHSRRHFSALRINGEDCWVRNVAIDETMNSVGIGGRRITLQRVSITRRAPHEGSSKPAEFAPNASQVLLDRCSVDADNVWFAATGGGQAGPIVLLNCTFRGTGRAESHQRWSTGMLFDNCRAPEGGLDFRNRGSMGSGHGWSMGWGVVWNCQARDYVVQQPPGAMNWMIGCVGRSRREPRPFGEGPHLPEGTMDSHGTPVAPQSLYLAQLAERLGPEAVKNMGYLPGEPLLKAE